MSTPQDLGGPLKFRVEQRSGATWVALKGNINEATSFAPLLRLGAPMVIDLSEVGRINSLGVRNWIAFVTQSEAMGRPITVEKFPPVMVGQMSMISNFMGTSSRISSVLAPFLCPKCNHEHLQLFEVAPGAAAAFEAPLPCPKCRTPMELDELPDTYLRLFPG